MKEDRTNTMFIHDVHKFQEMLLSGKHCVKSWDMFNDDVIQIQYKSEEGFEEQNPTVNCVIAAFTTCWARLHLLKFMEEIEEAGPDRILYHGEYFRPNFVSIKQPLSQSVRFLQIRTRSSSSHNQA